MKNLREINRHSDFSSKARLADASRLAAELETNGIIVLPSIVSPEQLRGMQAAFESRLRRVRWNNFDGYQRTEVYRQMVEDVLLLDQG
ncbi:MAG: hypothetical protein QOF72_1333, partial [Blastocatellia bacterium]|nr:hypothetical protein [Blastocatellia bacterium]